MDNFQGSSWQSGLSFNAIINFYHPNLFDYDNCFDDKSNIDVLNHAFNKAEVLGIGQLLDAEDIDKIDDDQSIFLYICLYYMKFDFNSKTLAERDDTNYYKPLGRMYNLKIYHNIFRVVCCRSRRRICNLL